MSLLLAATAPCPNCPASLLDLSSMTGPAVVLSGLVDGFNPCAFSIVIVLSGILAGGERHRRARLLGGAAFCVGTFVTYLAMGLGLLRVLRALEGLETLRLAFHTVLSLTLFALSFLSVRDALGYHRERTPQAIVLQLPDRVKRAIRAIAERSWSGPAVVVTGFFCGIGVTCLDSLCTGQVYVPILALLAREHEAWGQFGGLVLYNVAFLVPLIAVFVVAAKGMPFARLGQWSKRNVVPSKLALATVFFVLALAMMPKFGAAIAKFLI